MSNKLDKIKKIYSKLKEGKINFKSLTPEDKKELINFVIKKVGLWLFTEVILPALLIGVAIALLLYVFLALYEAIMALIAGIKRNFFFVLEGRSGSIDIHTVYRTKYELEQQGIEFEEIGYLGNEFLDGDPIKLPDKNGSFTLGEPINNPPVIATIGGFTAGESISNVKELIEYKDALEEKIETLKKDSNIVEVQANSTSLSTVLLNNKGKTIFLKLATEVTPTGKDPYTRYEYRTANVSSDGSTYTKWSEADDVYYAFNELKTNGIFYYLAKYLQAQAYTFNNNNPWTFDEEDKGSITINFVNDQEKKECKDIGFWQRLFEGATGSFSVYMNGDDFYAKIGKPEAGKNIKITQYVNDFAMPWRYPFAFHNSTLAPDVGYRVADLVYDHHVLDIDLWTVGKRDIVVEFASGRDEDDISDEHEAFLKNNDGTEVDKRKSVSDNFYSAYSGVGDVIAVPDFMRTWYRKENYFYTEERDESSKTKIGSLYQKIMYIQVGDYDYYNGDEKFESLKEFFDIDFFTLGQSVFYNTSTSAALDAKTESDRRKVNKNQMVSVDINLDPDEETWAAAGWTISAKVADVYAYDKYMALGRHDVMLNDEGIEDMDRIVESVPRYQYDSTGGKLEIQNPSDLKYYYTANSLQENSIKNGKTMLNIPTNAQSIIDAVYDIYDVGTDRDAAKDIESQFAKNPSSLASGKVNEGLANDNHYRRDYESAPKMVKDLICYFYEMGVIDDAEFASVYSNNSIFSSMLKAGTSIIWPLNQSTDQVSAISGNSIQCPAGTEVLSPVEGKVTSIIDNGDGTVQIIISREVTVEGSTTVATDTIILDDVSKTGLKVSVGTEVMPGDPLGVSAGSIEYTHINVDGTDVSEMDLENMQAMAKSDFKLPIRNPKVVVTSPYGMRSMGMHWGIDFSYGGIEGVEPIYASKAGTVIRSEALKNSDGTYKSYGEVVAINHGDNTYTLYAHMYPGTRKVKVGDTVDSNTVLGYVGNTGNSTGPHLHFEIRIGGNTYKTNNVDPAPYLFGTKSTTEVPDDVASDESLEESFTATGEGRFRFTYYTVASGDSGTLSTALTKIKATDIHPELGCYTYNGKVVLAGALSSRIGNTSLGQDWSRRDYIHYFDNFAEVAFEFKGKTYVGILADLCGVSMNPEGRNLDGSKTYWAGTIGEKNTLDVFFPNEAAVKKAGFTNMDNVKVLYLDS